VSDGKREGLSSNLAKSVRFHFNKYSATDLATFSVERLKTTYPKAKSDLVIFDSQGIAVMKGREFGGGQTSLWAS